MGVEYRKIIKWLFIPGLMVGGFLLRQWGSSKHSEVKIVISESLIQLANSGNSEAAFKLALTYDNALDTSDGYKNYNTNIENAILWYKKAIKFKHPEAKARLAFLFKLSHIPYQDYRASALLFEDLAQAGNRDAFFQLGEIYLNGGPNLPPNSERSSFWQKRYIEEMPGVWASQMEFEDFDLDLIVSPKIDALSINEIQTALIPYYIKNDQTNELEINQFTTLCANGDPKACYDLAYTYDKGLARPMNNENYLLMMKMYQKAADMGESKSLLKLGILSYFGQIKISNGLDDWYWFKKAAEANLPVAQYIVGYKYEDFQNLPEAAYWYGRASDNGLAIAQFVLGMRTMDDVFGSWPTDQLQSFYYGKSFYNRNRSEIGEALLRRAAEQGYPEACFNMGVISMARGAGTAPTKDAEYYFKTSIEKEIFPSAYHNLGLLRLLQTDREGAKLYFKKAAELGVLESMYNLGILFVEGSENIPINHEHALEWFIQSGKQGHEKSILEIGKIITSRPKNRNAHKDRDLLMGLITHKSSPEGSYLLGLHHFNHPINPIDISKSAQYFKITSDFLRTGGSLKLTRPNTPSTAAIPVY